MHFDFSAFLVLAVFVTGIIWLVDRLFYQVPRQAKAVHSSSEVKEPKITEYARSFFPVILLVLILRSFLFEPFKIPSGSMMPTLLIGDFILVNKYAYGLRLPVIEWEFWRIGRPERGDAAVFRFPKDPSLDYIKRIVGLPGDEIVYLDKALFINGEKAQALVQDSYQGEDSELLPLQTHVVTEQIDKHRFDTLIHQNKPSVEGMIVVPKDQYFVLGDNRDSSNDSRYWGFVPTANLVGRAELIWMSWDTQDTRIRWDRVGKTID